MTDTNLRNILGSATSTTKEKALAIAQAIAAGLPIGGTGAWEATTNIKECGGVGDHKKVIYQALKRAGYTYYLAMFQPRDEWGFANRRNGWGIISKEQISTIRNDPECVGMVTGYSLDAAAHRLGGGDANRGWAIFWQY